MDANPEPKAGSESTGVERSGRRERVSWRARIIRVVLNNAYLIYLLVRIIEAIKRLLMS